MPQRVDRRGQPLVQDLSDKALLALLSLQVLRTVEIARANADDLQGRDEQLALLVRGKGRFTLLTGIGGEGWRSAAAAVEAAYGVPVDVVTIGPAGCDALDIYADWYRQSEVEEDGCVLVRPDIYVAWRAREAMPNASDVLVKMFGALLGRTAEIDHRAKPSVAAA